MRPPGAHLADGAGEIALGDRPAVDPDALAHVLQVRRGEQPHPPAGTLQDGGDVMRGRALAVGAGDLHVTGGASGERLQLDDAPDVVQ
jgi:hypothetical protein